MAETEPFVVHLDEPFGDDARQTLDALREAVQVEHYEHHTGAFTHCDRRVCRVVNSR